jgi:hypothetical protein
MKARLICAALLLLFTSCERHSSNNDSSNVKVISTLPSPDGGYVATVYVVGGGGAAGWCDQRVAVNTKDEPFDFKKDTGADYFCFSASCGSKVQVGWSSTNSIQIRYTIGEAGVSIYQRWTPFGLPIRIEYVAE